MKFLFVAVCFLASCKSMMFEVRDGTISKVCLKDVPVGYKLNVPDNLYTTIDSGFQHWNDIFVNEIFVNVDETHNAVEWNPSCMVNVTVEKHSMMPDRWDELNRRWVRMAGFITKKTRNGCVTNAQIVVSDLYDSRPDMLQTVVRHEIGHMFALRDTIDYMSLMYRFVLQDMQHPIDVSDEEIKALKCLYGLIDGCDPKDIAREF
jgi:predicted Zn-dependent protease